MSPRKSRYAPFLALALVFAGLAVLLIFGPDRSVFDARDERLFHYPTIQAFAQQFPHLDLSHYPAATTPFYHICMMLAGFGVGATATHLRLVSLTVSLACLLVAYAGIVRRGGAAWALLISGLLAVSPYFLGSAIRLSTDNMALLFAFTALLLLKPGLRSPRRAIAASVAILLAILTRQIYAWLLGAYVLAALAAHPKPTTGAQVSTTAAPPGAPDDCSENHHRDAENAEQPRNPLPLRGAFFTRRPTGTFGRADAAPGMNGCSENGAERPERSQGREPGAVEGCAAVNQAAAPLRQRSGWASTSLRTLAGRLWPGLLPLAGLSGFLLLWRGLTPPAFAVHVAPSLNPEVFVYVVSLVGLYGSFFIGWLWQMAREQPIRPWAAAVILVLAALILLALPVSNEYPLADKTLTDRGGALWLAVARLPMLGPSALAFWVLLPLGLFYLFILARHLAARGELLWVFSFLLWLLANLTGTRVYQKYYEPFLIFWLGYALAVAPARRRWYGLGPVALLAGQAAVTLVRFFG